MQTGETEKFREERPDGKSDTSPFGEMLKALRRDI
jgi:hypothetical protein